MKPIVWLASYPKSGNTWFRVLISSLKLPEGETVDINNLAEQGGIASSREIFEIVSLIDSSLLTIEEVDLLRPAVYRAWAAGAADRVEVLADDVDRDDGVRFVKCHDAYTHCPNGEPLLGGRAAAKGAIVIVRDPRDVAPSLANHNHTDIDQAIAFMGDAESAFCNSRRGLPNQLRQQLPTWSGHVASWLDQTDLPVHIVRYEDLKQDTVAVFRAAMAFAGRRITQAEAERAVALADFSNLKRQEAEKGFREWRAKGGEGAFFRRGEVGAWRDELTDAQRARVESDQAVVMGRLGYAIGDENVRLCAARSGVASG